MFGRRTPRFEPLEDRRLLALASPLIHVFPTGHEPFASQIVPVDADGTSDLVVLNTDGTLSVALHVPACVHCMPK